MKEGVLECCHACMLQAMLERWNSRMLHCCLATSHAAILECLNAYMQHCWICWLAVKSWHACWNAGTLESRKAAIPSCWNLTCMLNAAILPLLILEYWLVVEMLKVGILELWSAWILECWMLTVWHHDGMLHCCNAGMLMHWNAGTLLCWYAGMLGCWHACLAECWIIGRLEC